jgi:hypothetical protein
MFVSLIIPAIVLLQAYAISIIDKELIMERDLQRQDSIG